MYGTRKIRTIGGRELMIYVALLRGINVGGKNKVDMKKLKKCFEDIGMRKVTTYINSGNVIFEDTDHTKDEIATMLEKAILKDFSLFGYVNFCNNNAPYYTHHTSYYLWKQACF
jgi:hypothetical protein